MALPSGVYTIKNVYNCGLFAMAMEKWEVEKLHDGTYRIRSQLLPDRANYKIIDTNDLGDPQHWRINNTDGIQVYWVSDLDGVLCWTLGNDDKITLEKYTQNDNQHWKILGENEVDDSQMSLYRLPSIRMYPPPSSNFTGRQDILAKMHEYFSSDLGKRHVFVLHGLGGVGKSEILHKFIEECQVNTKPARFSDVFFIDAITAESAAADFRSIALAKTTDDGSPEIALRWLSRKKGEWLLVIENADDPSLNLSDYFPDGSFGNIIVTSRNSETRMHAPDPQSNSNVSCLPPEDANDLFFKIAGMTEEQDDETKMLAGNFLEELGHLPLAIVQAGSYISHSGCGLVRYIEMYRDRRSVVQEEYRDQVQKIDDYERAVYTTWRIIFEKLSPLAAMFMNICAFFHHDGIHTIIFQRAATNVKTRKFRCSPESTALKVAKEFLSSFHSDEGHWELSKFMAVLSEIRSYSLIDFDERNEMYFIHPLVHDWTRRKLSNDTTIHECSQFILSLSINDKPEPYDIAFRQVLLPHVDASLRDVTAVDPDVAACLWWPYGEGGQWKEAEKLIVHAADMSKRILGEEDPNTLKCTISLASTYWGQGKLKESEELGVRLVEMCKRVLGEEHPDTLNSMANLATTYYNQERLEECVELGVRVVEILDRGFGDRVSALASMSNLAWAYTSQGRWNDSEEMGVRVVEMSKRVLGEDHPRTLRSITNLARAYYNQGRWKENEELLLRVVEKERLVFGEDHPETLTSMGNLAATYNSLMRWQESEELGVRVVEMRKRILGEDHCDTLASMSNLAATYKYLGRLKESEELGVRVLETRRRNLGEDHCDTLASMSNLAATYEHLGRLKESEELGVRVLEMRRRNLGEDHPDTLTAMGNLMVTYRHQKRWKESEEFGARVLETRKRVLGEDHPDTLMTMSHLAVIYCDLGRLREAEELIVRVVGMQKRVLGEEHHDTLSSMFSLTSIYRDLGRWDEAVELGARLVEMRKRCLGEDHPDTLMAMGRLAMGYSQQGRKNEGKELIVRVLETQKRALGEEHHDTLSTMAILTTIYADQERWDEAEELGVKLVEMRKRCLGEDHLDTLVAMFNLAMVYFKLGRTNEGEELAMRVLERQKWVIGEEHFIRLSFMANLTAAYANAGRWDEAEELGVKLVKTCKRVFGDDHPLTRRCITNMEAIVDHSGWTRMAKNFMKRLTGSGMRYGVM